MKALAERATADDLTVYDDGPVQRRIIADALTDLAVDGAPLRVLEAGCGQMWPIDVSGYELHITGIDLDAEAMSIRRELHGDLDVEIVGDLRTVEIPQGAFDVVYCSFVLEHIAGAAGVLDRLVAAVRPGGRVILRIPDGKTVYGFVVRRTPYMAHVWFRRIIGRERNAGKPGHAPYRTYYDDVVSLPGIRAYARNNGLEVVALFGSNQYLKSFGKARSPIAWVVRTIGNITGGRLRGTHNNLVVILQRPGGDATGERADSAAG
jgi:SAM-dependent methyltransferase